MREEIYLFYKNIFEPRFVYYKKLLSRYISEFSKLYLSKFKKEEKSKVQEESFIKYLFIGQANDCRKYEDLFGKLMFIDKSDFYVTNFDSQYLYIMLGKYEEVFGYLKHLRLLNLNVLLDQKYMELDNNRPLWKRRVYVIEAIYSDLIIEQLNVSNVGFLDKKEWIDFENSIFNNYLENKENYKETLNRFLKEGWTWNRLNFMVVAILMEAIAEIDVIETPINVLIEQSVKTTKNYCGEDEYKLVNGILNNYFRSRSNEQEI